MLVWGCTTPGTRPCDRSTDTTRPCDAPCSSARSCWQVASRAASFTTSLRIATTTAEVATIPLGRPATTGSRSTMGSLAITRGSSTSTMITIATTAATRAIVTDVTSGTTARGVTRLRTGHLLHVRRAVSLPKTLRRRRVRRLTVTTARVERSADHPLRRLRSTRRVEGRKRATTVAWLSSSAARDTAPNADREIIYGRTRTLPDPAGESR